MARSAVEKFNERKTRLTNVQNLFSDEICDFLVDINVTQRMTDREWGRWVELRDEMVGFSNWVDETVQTATQRDLSMLATRLKRFILYGFKMANKYDAFQDELNVYYDSARKVIVAGGDDLYFLD